MPTDVASIEDLAEAEFEPWTEAAGDFPDSEKLDEQMRACIVTLRIAWRVMHSKKASLVTMFRTIDDELGAYMKDDFISSIDWLKGALKHPRCGRGEAAFRWRSRRIGSAGCGKR